MITVAGREIDGELATEPVTTFGPGHEDRWVEFRLYALDNGQWLIHRAGMSNVYHKIDTRCVTRTGRQSGDPAGVDDLPDDAMPCLVCRPEDPEYLPGGPGTVRFERPRHTWDECPTAFLVKAKLTTVRSRDGSVSTFTSDPVDQLLWCAAQRYPEFAGLIEPAA